ncbi:MAG: ribosome-recycling factor, partial [Gammaproteobacteria bacterium]
RDANNDFKELLKEKDISEDESHQAEDNVQKYTNKYVTSVDEVIAIKEKELMEI